MSNKVKIDEFGLFVGQMATPMETIDDWEDMTGAVSHSRVWGDLENVDSIKSILNCPKSNKCQLFP